MHKAIPTVNLVFRNTLDMGIGQIDLRDALNEFVLAHLEPAWGVSCKLRVGGPGPGYELWFVDDADQAGVLGFHDVEMDGQARGFVSVRDCLAHEEPVSVVASHEIGEMLPNPMGSLGVFTPRGRWIALEICDPVQRETFTVNRGVPVSSFVYPAWFGFPGGLDCDHTGECSLPFQVLPAGYIPVFEHGRWSNLFGSTAAQRLYGEEDRRLHRTERIVRRSTPTEGLTANTFKSVGVAGVVC